MTRTKNEVDSRFSQAKGDHEATKKYYSKLISELEKEHKARMLEQQKIFRNSLTWKVGRLFVLPFEIVIRMAALTKNLIRKFTIPKKTGKKKNFKDVKEKPGSGKVKQVKTTNIPIGEPVLPIAACILDEFTYSCLKPELNLITFTPDNWHKILKKTHPDVLFVESAWKGNFGTWQYKIAKYEGQDKSPLLELIKWCKAHQVPTIFWNKEDPIHFDKFIDTAILFDLIFTTDQNIIDDYKMRAGHDKVFVLPFAAQPLLHNPIKITEERISKACFAGSYYANRHEARREDMERVLDVTAKSGLVIYDRNYEMNQKEITHLTFPDRFAKYIVGSLKYNQIDVAYKGYKVMINVNSVKDSPTMFSRRVFEGLACGTPIISTYSEGINRMFRNIVTISEDEKALESSVKKLLTNNLNWDKTSILGIRKVMLKHTYKHRLQHILELTGIDYTFRFPEIGVISIITTKADLENILPYCKSQTYDSVRFFFFLKKFEGYEDILNQYNDGHYNSFIYSYLHNYDHLGQLISSDYLAYFSGKHFYSSNYIMDMALAISYSKSEIITRPAVFQNENNLLISGTKRSSYTYVDQAWPSMSIISTGQFKNMPVKSALDFLAADKNLRDLFRFGARIFAIDGYNFIKDGNSQDSLEKRKVTI